MVSGPIAPSSPGMGYLTTLSVPPRAPHPAAFAGSRAVDRRINRPSKTNAARENRFGRPAWSAGVRVIAGIFVHGFMMVLLFLSLRSPGTDAVPRGVNPVPVPAREMEGSVREFMLNCNGWEADCLYPL